MYGDTSTIGIMIKDYPSNKKDISFEKIIEEYFKGNKIENLILVEEVNSKVEIDYTTGNECIYKGKIKGIEGEELMVDIVTFENDGKQYFLILSGVGENMGDIFQENRDEFYKFIKSIKIVS